MKKLKLERKITPYIKIFLSFAGMILLGAILLYLPISSQDNQKPLTFIEALFMATSSMCVTGLSVVSNVGAQFSVFGKIVIAILVEIGGLSFLTITIFILVLIGRKIKIADRFLMKEALNLNTSAGVVSLIKTIIKITLTIQGVGVLLYFIGFIRYYDFLDALGISIFHSISCFNNAGIDIFGTSSSMIMFQNDIYINILTMVSIILGGIGFVVIYDILKNKKWKRFNLHTKIVLVTTAVLIISGAILFKISMIKDITWLEAIFQSVSARTAGFSTIDMSTLSKPAYIVMLFLMFIGASPCSTGGGIKTTTLFVIIMTIVSYAKGKSSNVFNRKISSESRFKAFALASLSVLFVIIVTFILSFTEMQASLDQIVFEVVSAFGTVGLSMGLTTTLSPLSQIVLSITMFFGRLGPLTIISLWNANWMQKKVEGIRYVEEKIIIG